MIRIEKIEIIEFRGIRYLELNLERKNLGIAGPNGTGKSGVVDAIEFALTGNITRLGGAGTAELSVKAHAPHVDSAKHPEKAIVRVTAHARSLNKTIIIERSVKAANNPKLTPESSATRALLAQMETHPEFALSRREIIKYILTPAGERSKEVQILLRLDQIEKLRTSLQRIANDTKKDSTRAKNEADRNQQELVLHLGVKAATKDEFVAAINARREILKLDPVVELLAKNSIKIGVISDGDETQQTKPRISKAVALLDLAAHEGDVGKVTSEAAKKEVSDISGFLERLADEPKILKSLRQKILIDQGIALIDDDTCPLCDTTWDAEALKAHLYNKAAEAESAIARLTELDTLIRPVLERLESLSVRAKKLVPICADAEPKIEAKPLADFIAVCVDDHEVLRKLKEDLALIPDAMLVLERLTDPVPSEAAEVVAAVRVYVSGLPDASKEDAAKEFLIVAQEKYDRTRDAIKESDSARARESLAAKVLDNFGLVSTSSLERIFDIVQKDFTTYYSYINRDDEEKFEGTLTPSVGKLAFDVDFYGRGKHPPGAYHSEGHQDGMGLCLYLALMKHTLGDDFTLAVLDDVLMSVDSGHRREVCSLLKIYFPQTQFVLTTHDPVWLQFMRSENLIQASITFGGWTVETGPQVWSDEDVWKQIDDKLAKQDVPGAAATLRRYLEYISTILADNLQGTVKYQANGHYDLGDLWPGVTQAWKARLRESIEVAKSWGTSTSDIESMESAAKAHISEMQSEQWMINKAVHYNEWVALQPKEFAVVAGAFQSFLRSMQCKNAACGEFLFVTPKKGKREAMRCGCGQNNLNLSKK